MTEQILILDFGSQFTQLIARRVRELNVYCEIHPFNKIPEITSEIKGIILSGSPCSVREADAPLVDWQKFAEQVPVLGVCYGAQLMAQTGGGEGVVSHRISGALFVETALIEGRSGHGTKRLQAPDITFLPADMLISDCVAPAPHAFG